MPTDNLNPRLSLLHKVELDWITPDPEKVIAKHARTSTKDPDRPEYIKLLTYCIKQGHVSVFEQACASYEIITTRSISPQILRHRSFCFQETSQRYCNPFDVLGDLVGDPASFEFRGQDLKNRQNSVEYGDDEVELKYRGEVQELYAAAQRLYEAMVGDGVARECARNILPLCAPTRLHMQGNLRNWIFYVGLRSAPGTQAEHRYIANLIGRDLRRRMPSTIQAIIDVAHADDTMGLRGWKFIDEG